MPHPLFTLGNRLSLCASMVREGTKLVDIGTDHAYLPIWLVRKGRISNAIAADVKLSPLRSAERNIRRYHVEEQVSARLSDGLDAVFPNEADDIVMAGMGGELIIRLIGAAPWLKQEHKRLILQPMTAADKLRLYLEEKGFFVEKERAAIDNRGLCYSAMLVRYQPDCQRYGELFPYIGILDGSTEESRAYLNKRADSLQRKAEGLKISGEREKAEFFFRIVEKIRRLALYEEKEEN